MRVVVFEMEIVVSEVENALYVGIDNHAGKGSRLSGKLNIDLLEMIVLDMSIAEGMNEVACFKSGDLCHHHKEQCVRCYVERHTEEYIGAALV